MIPDGIKQEHLDKAVAEIIEKGVPAARKSIHYDYVHSGRLYPPKYIISVASKYAFGKELPPSEFNAVRARDYLRSRGHKVIDRRAEKVELIQDENDEQVFVEGADKFKLHRYRERDSSLTRQAKINRLDKFGKLACDVCKFDFSEVYGELGVGFIEAHHTVPISSLDGEAQTKLSDIALVCSNCHRMLHRQKEVRSISSLRGFLEQKPRL